MGIWEVLFSGEPSAFADEKICTYMTLKSEAVLDLDQQSPTIYSNGHFVDIFQPSLKFVIKK